MPRVTTSRSCNRWIVLVASVLAQSATSMFQFGIPFLVPEMKATFGDSLAVAAALVACPSVGMMLTLIVWGLVADRLGDRLVMSLGLVGASAMLALTSKFGSALAIGALLVLAGAFGSSVNVTSGRVILKSFDSARRGLAMGIRQTSPLIGMGLAALAFPRISSANGYQSALLLASGTCLVAAAVSFAVVRDPRILADGHPTRATTPYSTMHLWRLHGASALLVVPQIGVYSFAFLFLIERERFATSLAGLGIAAALAAGALLRMLAGVWSDRVAKRLMPMRVLAILSAITVSLTATLILVGSSAAGAVILMATAISASWNGLAFTAVAEYAGMAWAGRALGVQNTVQYVTTAATPPLMAVLISTRDFATAFYVASGLGLVGALLIPLPWRSPRLSRSSQVDGRR